MPDYKCKFCQMLHQEDYDVYYGQSTHWMCVGDKETGNPTIIYKKHYADTITDSQMEEAKVLAVSLLVKYWKDTKIDVKIHRQPHTCIEISEAKNELPHKS